MTSRNSNSHQMPILWKVLCIALIAFCVVVGLIGLILPVIPGILFLFIAALLLARISHRFDSILKASPTFGGWMKQADPINELSVLRRVKLSFWLCARFTVNGIEAGMSRFKKTRG